jgi:hypothetical protein
VLKKGKPAAAMHKETYPFLPLLTKAESPARPALGGLDRLAHVLYLVVNPKAVLY